MRHDDLREGTKRAADKSRQKLQTRLTPGEKSNRKRVIEGACRYLVKDRMDRTGARWSLTGAEAVLRLRALRASKDFDAYWPFHLEQEWLRNHAERYQDANVPNPMPPPKPHIKRVK